MKMITNINRIKTRSLSRNRIIQQLIRRILLRTRLPTKPQHIPTKPPKNTYQNRTNKHFKPYPNKSNQNKPKEKKVSKQVKTTTKTKNNDTETKHSNSL
jgi:hypothetical protein